MVKKVTLIHSPGTKFELTYHVTPFAKEDIIYIILGDMSLEDYCLQEKQKAEASRKKQEYAERAKMWILKNMREKNGKLTN